MEKSRLLIERIQVAKQELAKYSAPPPENYHGIKCWALIEELKQEYSFFNELLTSLPETSIENFEWRFINRCVQRCFGKIHAVPFSDLIDTPANRLYWDLAMILFAPSTMGEMLSFIMPDLINLVEPDLSEDITVSLKEHKKRGFEPLLTVRKGLTSMTTIPRFEDLSHLVMENGYLIDLRQIARFPLRSQGKFFNKLNEISPKLVKKIFTHNQNFVELERDIQIMQACSVTPREAIDTLAEGLEAGGERLSGQKFATAASNNAIDGFLRLLETLPDQIVEKIKQLGNQHQTVEDILVKHIDRGECVETCASFLRSVSASLKDHPFANTPLKLSLKELKALEKKYQEMPSVQSVNRMISLPSAHIISSIKLHQNVDNQELIYLILNYPPHYYLPLILNLDYQEGTEPRDVIELLLSWRTGLSNQQRDSLLDVALEYVLQDDPTNKWSLALNWAKKRNNPEVTNAVLRKIPQEDLADAICDARNTYNDFYLRKKEILYTLTRLSESDRLRILELGNFRNHCPMDYVGADLNALLEVLRLLPVSGRLQLFKSPGPDNIPWVVRFAVRYPFNFSDILTLIPATQLMGFLSENNDIWWTFLDYCPVSSIESLISMLPEGDRLSALILTDNINRTLLERCNQTLVSIVPLLLLLPPKDRLRAVFLNAQITGNHTPFLYSHFEDILRDLSSAHLSEYFHESTDTSAILLYFNSKFGCNMKQVYNALLALEDEAMKMQDNPKSKVVLELVDALKEKMSQFLMDGYKQKQVNEKELIQFRKEMLVLLHSRDSELGIIRNWLKPFFANLLIALTGIGLVALAVNTVYQLARERTDSQPIGLKDFMFFTKTHSESMRDKAETFIEETIPKL